MGQYNLNERIWLVRIYYKSHVLGRNGGPNLKYTMQKYEEQFNRSPPTKWTIHKLIKKHEESGTVANLNSSYSGRPRTARTNENHGRVLDAVL